MFFWELYQDRIFLIVFIIFIVVTAIQLIYYWGIFSRLSFFKGNNENARQEPVSVIICARNEYHNLQENLPLILEQDYPEFEVLVINDNSDDETIELLKMLKFQYKHLNYASVTGDMNSYLGKKFPLAVGIKSAKNDLMILTDADCKPTSKNWITNIQKNFTEDTEIVLGYGPYEKRAGLLNKLIRFDTFYIALQYLSLSLSGQTYMGVGRNMAYRKSMFMKNKGFSSLYYYKIKSGDDDLFINKVATSKNTKIEISHESHVISFPKIRLSSWFYQKKRHLTTSVFYKFKFKFILSLLAISHLMFYLCFIFLIFADFKILYIILLFVIRLTSQIIIFRKSMEKLNEKDLLYLSPLLDFAMVLINPLIYMSNLFVKQNKWKQDRV
ncbi:MAG: glycosyltransferase [Bacteroidota bacterium]|nr:glycosyltransferase [Bacteroidota bacterium]